MPDALLVLAALFPIRFERKADPFSPGHRLMAGSITAIPLCRPSSDMVSLFSEFGF